MQLKINTSLQSGRYRIIRVLGQGGFGITYLAENIVRNRLVAIKEFFPKDFCGRDNTSQLTIGTQNVYETVAKLKYRFLKEAENIAKLDHPGIVKIHDVFEENNTAYYVMDYVEGENLNDIIKHNGSFSLSNATKLIRKIGDALDYIHSRNITHFDVKPSNIMMRKSDNQPILIDFGLSKQFTLNGDATSTLMQGISKGYSPIELYSSNVMMSFSPQTDIYSLAATLYFLLTATPPPTATYIIAEGMSYPSWIPLHIKQAINYAMEPNRLKRPMTVGTFTESLTEKIYEDSQNCQDNDDTFYYQSDNAENGTNQEKTTDDYIDAVLIINDIIKEVEREIYGGVGIIWIILIIASYIYWYLLDKPIDSYLLFVFIYSSFTSIFLFALWCILRGFIVNRNIKLQIRNWVRKNPNHPYSDDFISIYKDNISIIDMMNPFSANFISIRI